MVIYLSKWGGVIDSNFLIFNQLHHIFHKYNLSSDYLSYIAAFFYGNIFKRLNIMFSMKKKVVYSAPVTEVLALQSEGVICGSEILTTLTIAAFEPGSGNMGYNDASWD